jgi:hypothetical protein
VLKVLVHSGCVLQSCLKAQKIECVQGRSELGDSPRSQVHQKKLHADVSSRENVELKAYSAVTMQQDRGASVQHSAIESMSEQKRNLDVLARTRNLSQETQGKARVILQELGSLKLWGPGASTNAQFRPKIVSRLYHQHLLRSKSLWSVQILELSQYLECYLWPHFDSNSSDEHVMSIVVLVNEKFREGISAWDAFVEASAPEITPADTQKWLAFVNRVLGLTSGEPRICGRPMAPPEATQYLRFLIHLFQSLEVAHVRAAVLPLASLPLWHALSERRRQIELLRDPRLAKKWRAMGRKAAKEAAAAHAEVRC